MNILTSQLPSGGIGYNFPSVNVSPMTFLEICKYMENLPEESLPLERYMYDINMLVREDPNIMNCYIMDVDFLIFYKKLCTVSGELKYNLSVRCPNCGNKISHTLNFEKDIHFKGADPKVMNGARIELGGHVYDVRVPTLRNFMNVFQVYLRVKKITDLDMIKTIALIDDFSLNGNQVEKDVLDATHSDITLLLALKDIYYDQVEPIQLYCPDCDKQGGRGMAVSVSSLTVDFFPDIVRNSPIDGSKILFK